MRLTLSGSNTINLVLQEINCLACQVYMSFKLLTMTDQTSKGDSCVPEAGERKYSARMRG